MRTRPDGLDVVYPAERDVTGWQERHAVGEVPGRWPYGLDELGDEGLDVRAVGLPAPGRLRSAAARWARVTRWARWTRWAESPAAAGGRVALAWDENVAHRVAVLAPRARLHAGAIWVTDALARGRDDAPTRARVSALRRAQGVWCLSSAQLEPLGRLLPGMPVSLLRFGVDSRFFSPAPPAERPLVVSAGGDRDRDAVTLFAALAQVRRAHPEAEVVVQTQSTAPPPDGVRVVRYLPHARLRDLYARASVVVVTTSPNLHVSGMTVALEAMATARPVVVTATPGVADYVRDGVTGLLARTGDPASAADAVVALLDDPDGAAAMGRRGRDAVEGDLNTTRMARDLRVLLGLAPPTAATG